MPGTRPGRAGSSWAVPSGFSPGKRASGSSSPSARGSYLVHSPATAEGTGPAGEGDGGELSAAATAPAVFRSRDEIARFFEGLDLVPPGISDVAAWRPGTPPAETSRVLVLGGIGK